MEWEKLNSEHKEARQRRSSEANRDKEKGVYKSSITQFFPYLDFVLS